LEEKRGESEARLALAPQRGGTIGKDHPYPSRGPVPSRFAAPVGGWSLLSPLVPPPPKNLWRHKPRERPSPPPVPFPFPEEGGTRRDHY
jgi:hypothetical protein